MGKVQYSPHTEVSTRYFKFNLRKNLCPPKSFTQINFFFLLLCAYFSTRGVLNLSKIDFGEPTGKTTKRATK